MNIHAPSPLLGGMSPQQFMRRHWQQKPLLVRQAWPGVQPPLTRSEVFAAMQNPDLESRLVVQPLADETGPWKLRHGPLPRRALPPARRRGWTLLLQGLDLHVDAAHDMLKRFRFVPDALLDDLMLSWASEGGGVGPHLDEYDVFLLQVQGRRLWRVGPVEQPQWESDTPLKRLRHFVPTLEWLLEPGDLLYLPPLWGHDGVAVGGECMTCSIGFRAPSQDELASDLLQRLADDEAAADDGDSSSRHGGRVPRRYRHPRSGGTDTPGALPPSLQGFAQAAIARRLAQPGALAQVLGQWATEPKARVWFEAGTPLQAGCGVALHARTRMMFDDRHVFINGEAYRAGGADARRLQQLANDRELPRADVARLSAGARALLSDWTASGWVLQTSG